MQSNELTRFPEKVINGGNKKINLTERTFARVTDKYSNFMSNINDYVKENASLEKEEEKALENNEIKTISYANIDTIEVEEAKYSVVDSKALRMTPDMRKTAEKNYLNSLGTPEKENNHNEIKESNEIKNTNAKVERDYEVPEIVTEYEREKVNKLDNELKEKLAKALEENLNKVKEENKMIEEKEVKSDEIKEEIKETLKKDAKVSNNENLVSVLNKYKESQDKLNKQDESIAKTNQSLKAAEDAQAKAEKENKELIEKLIKKTMEIQELQATKMKLEAEKKQKIENITKVTENLAKENEELNKMLNDNTIEHSKKMVA